MICVFLYFVNGILLLLRWPENKVRKEMNDVLQKFQPFRFEMTCNSNFCKQTPSDRVPSVGKHTNES